MKLVCNYAKTCTMYWGGFLNTKQENFPKSLQEFTHFKESFQGTNIRLQINDFVVCSQQAPKKDHQLSYVTNKWMILIKSRKNQVGILEFV